MKQSNRTEPSRFESEGRFEAPARCVGSPPSRAAQQEDLEQLKNLLLQERLARINEAELNARLQRAANDAAALAWVTNFPLLVFPILFEEKAQTALLQAGQQAYVRERSRELLIA